MHGSASRETCLPPSGCSWSWYTLYSIHWLLLCAALPCRYVGKALGSCKNAGLIWQRWACARWCRHSRPAQVMDHHPSSSTKGVAVRWCEQGRWLYPEGGAVSCLRQPESWILQPLPFQWVFRVNRKVFTRGLLVFLGAWPESLGSGLQLCWTCPPGTKVSGCLLSMYRTCFVGQSLLEIQGLSVRIARSMFVDFFGNLFLS